MKSAVQLHLALHLHQNMIRPERPEEWEDGGPDLEALHGGPEVPAGANAEEVRYDGHWACPSAAGAALGCRRATDALRQQQQQQKNAVFCTCTGLVRRMYDHVCRAPSLGLFKLINLSSKLMGMMG